MKILIASFLLNVMLIVSTIGQTLDTLKLSPNDIPESYELTDKMLHKSIQAINFYNQVDLYESLIGTVKYKAYQSFKNKKDSGTIFYVEFEGNFEGETFLEGLLWGEDKPSKSHPEEYLVKGKVLIIWSFKQNSELKEISRAKIAKRL